ncbi:hypothetical protein TraAM80_09583 [Trypanosoma rangeli]|uniref:Uncharacterized protein n=1 Tax=Trypanosoma rangeli TaxID=5698 RepID=A0A3R7JU59_TRYRA|nr:uncharacterized protein TraAM80_09583 [Trypanosoma rangeli]RNE96900.1 hypothetical protein TraAM80_09583 [Trypanosoma rangeli]|eukprot:RNE96900.1 hypothetical protein TraAM80_09583 [Trypanosoma rangeli]
MVKSSGGVQPRLLKRTGAGAHAASPAGHSGSRGNSVGVVGRTAGAEALPGVGARDTPQRESRLQRKAKKEGQPLTAKQDASSSGRRMHRGARGGQHGGAARATTIVRDGQRPARRSAGGGRKQEQHRQLAAKLVARERHPSRRTAAEARMETAKAELALFDQVLQAPSFVENPFAAIEGHLNEAMTCLQPQTPDVGRRCVKE